METFLAWLPFARRLCRGPVLFVGLLLAFLPTVGQAQVGSLSADAAGLLGGGGVIRFTLEASYVETPTALAWSVELPEGWSIQETVSEASPPIAPQPGARGTLEWAYVTVPARHAKFDFIIRYPAQQNRAHAIKAVLITREAGALRRVAIEPLTLRPRRALPVRGLLR